jgi:diacylglycerol kinase family enzyme
VKKTPHLILFLDEEQHIFFGYSELLLYMLVFKFVGPNHFAYSWLQFSDGYLDLIIMKDCPRWTLLNLLLKLQTGGHIKSKYVEYLKVSLIPHSKNPLLFSQCNMNLAQVKLCTIAVTWREIIANFELALLAVVRNNMG